MKENNYETDTPLGRKKSHISYLLICFLLQHVAHKERYQGGDRNKKVIWNRVEKTHDLLVTLK